MFFKKYKVYRSLEFLSCCTAMVILYIILQVQECVEIVHVPAPIAKMCCSLAAPRIGNVPHLKVHDIAVWLQHFPQVQAAHPNKQAPVPTQMRASPPAIL